MCLIRPPGVSMRKIRGTIRVALKRLAVAVTRHSASDRQPPASPLLKWAGGKRQLLPSIRPFYPKKFCAYVEPFFGSGAVFFDLLSSGRLDGHQTVLIDSNPDLVGCYQMVTAHEEAVGAALDQLAADHARLGTAHYYDVRDQRFNPMRDARRSADGGIAYTPELAAMLIYLNRTGFNGLFRVNARGQFNVPAGRYERPRIADRARLHGVASALGQERVSLRCGTFTDVLALATCGDFRSSIRRTRRCHQPFSRPILRPIRVGRSGSVAGSLIELAHRDARFC